MRFDFRRAGLLFLATLPIGVRAAAQGPAAADPRYASAARTLAAFVDHERAQKQIPAFSLAVASGRRIIWEAGFGWADSASGAAASATTTYPIPALRRLAASSAAAGGQRARGTLWTLDGRRFDAAPDSAGGAVNARELATGVERASAVDAGAPGFAGSILATPDSLAVAVLASLDAATATTRRIAEEALRLARAARAGGALVPPDTTRALTREESLRLAGRYGAGERAVALEEYEGRLFLTPLGGGVRTEVRRGPGSYVTDDVLGFGTPVVPLPGDRLVVGRDTLSRVRDARPPEAPAALARLLGEYGPDQRIFYLLERDGRVTGLADWFWEYPLTRVSGETFRFPAGSRLAGEVVRVEPGAGGRPAALVVGGQRLPRRPLPGDDDAVSFRITPVRPVEQLRREALAAAPPKEADTFARPDLVELRSLDRTIRYDIRYATRNNFLGTPMYTSAHAFLQRPAARALAAASAELQKLGYGLLIHDAYRPWYVTRMFWDATPPDKHVFVADPARGSRHNRGAAVDLSLYDLRTGTPVRMTGGYDEMSDRSYPLYPGGASSQRWHRDLLRHAMERHGFTVYEAEWWHFDFAGAQRYPILNLTFEELSRGGSPEPAAPAAASGGAARSDSATSPPTILAVFAHPDDERIVGPLLARYARAGAHVLLVVATDGRKGVTPHAGIPAGDSLAKLRSAEARCAADRLGIEAPRLLGLEDAGLASFTALGSLRDSVARVLVERRPDAVLTFGPEGGTGHPDHRLVGDVVTELVQRGAEGAPDALFYPSLGTERMRSAPAARPQIGTMADRHLSVVVPFEAADLEATRRAFACHASQYTPAQQEAVMRYLEHGFDGAVRLRPWNGSAVWPLRLPDVK